MKLYRYELFCDDEPQDVGFLVGIDDLGLSSEVENHLLEPFDKHLSIPDAAYMRNSVSFFTEAGNLRFQKEILCIAAAYESSIFDLKVCMLDLPEHFSDSILYQDENQVCIPRQIYHDLDPTISREYFPSEEYNNVSFKSYNSLLIGDLYHVGTMDISKKSSHSHEGNGLSVSNCPDAWCRINKGFTYGDYFKLSKPDMKLLDFYALSEEEKGIIQAWAVENGYVEQGTLYKSISNDEEGYECFSLYSSYDEAFLEADEEEDRVKATSGLLPTQKLLDQSLVKVELLQVPDIITALYAEQVLDYDGIYWDEILDELSYSAPRGVIFNSKLPSFEVENTSHKREAKQSVDAIIQSAAARSTKAQDDHILTKTFDSER